MTEDGGTQRLSTEGADQLSLTGVNDSNLNELARITGARITMRGDTLTITAPTAESLGRAAELAQRLIELARQGGAITPDDVLRLSLDAGRDGDGAGGAVDTSRLALPGVRRVIQAKTSGQAEYMQKIAENDNWDPTLAIIFVQVGAVALTPGSRDAALQIVLPPGAYTAQVSGINGGVGDALVEVYEIR